MAVVLLLLTLFFGLQLAPGLHFDEAWAANYAHRIAFEPGFWPWRGMSPYTSAWAHYWGAAWFQVFGTSLFVFRASQIALTLLGLGFLAAALVRRQSGAVAAVFLFLVGTSCFFIWNHRFAIELHGWHVFCAGLAAWALANPLKPRAWALSFALVAGITAHLLFYAVALALFALWLKKREVLAGGLRRALGIAWVLVGIFFLQMWGEVPERKRILLLLTAHGLIGLTLFFQHKVQWAWLTKILGSKPWRFLLALAAVVPGLLCLFFLEGSWVAALHTGELAGPGLGLLIVGLVCLGLFWARAQEAVLWWLLAFLLITVLGMAPKPTPRYFELPALCLAALLAVSICSRPFWQRAAYLGLWAGVGLSTSFYTVLAPVVLGQQQDAEFRRFGLKDSSSDFLSEQFLVGVIRSAGCGISDITTGDGRLVASLRFLEKDKFQPQAGALCRWPMPASGLIRAERGMLVGPDMDPDAKDLAGYRVWGVKR